MSTASIRAEYDRAIEKLDEARADLNRRPTKGGAFKGAYNEALEAKREFDACPGAVGTNG